MPSITIANMRFALGIVGTACSKPPARRYVLVDLIAAADGVIDVALRGIDALLQIVDALPIAVSITKILVEIGGAIAR